MANLNMIMIMTLLLLLLLLRLMAAPVYDGLADDVWWGIGFDATQTDHLHLGRVVGSQRAQAAHARRGRLRIIGIQIWTRSQMTQVAG